MPLLGYGHGVFGFKQDNERTVRPPTLLSANVHNARGSTVRISTYVVQKALAQVHSLVNEKSPSLHAQQDISPLPLMMRSLTLLSALFAYNGVLAAPRATMVEERHIEERQLGPSVKITNPTATIVGRTVPYADINPIAAGVLESFKQIPFAQPPVGQLRLKPPVPLDTSKNLGTIDATALAAKACPQQIRSEKTLAPPDLCFSNAH